MRTNHLRKQYILIIISFYNLIINYSPFFLKNYILKMTGCKIGKKTYLHFNLKLYTKGRLEIGDNCTINNNCILDNRKKITLGNNTMLGHNVKIYTLSHDFNDPLFGDKGGAVKISDNVVIFPNSIIMPNTIISEGVVVLPGCVLSGVTIVDGVYGGVPGKLISKRNPQKKYKLNYGYYFSN